MSTQRQIDANRKNAEMSTGPKTDEGKANSRGNALKHGLSGEGIVETPEERAKLETQLVLWRRSFQKELEGNDVGREFLFRQVVLNSIRMDAAQDREIEIHHTEKQNAILNWETDRELQAETLGASIAKNPSLVVAKLRTFLQGCEWLIAQWIFLKDLLEQGESLKPSQLSLLNDLLGIPALLRGAKTEIDNAKALSLIENALESLGGDLLENLKALDRHERLAAERGFVQEISREERLNRRYEDLATKRFNAARIELARLRPEPTQSKPMPRPTTAVEQPIRHDADVERAIQQTRREPRPSVVPSLRNEPIATLGKMTGSVLGFSVGVAPVRPVAGREAVRSGRS